MIVVITEVMVSVVIEAMIEEITVVMVMIPQRRDQGYNCKNVLLPWNPHPHLPVLLFLVAQNQLTPRKKNEVCICLVFLKVSCSVVMSCNLYKKKSFRN